MKRILSLLLAVLSLLWIAGCTADPVTEDGKIHIVTTTFPAYDFARAVIGDRGTVTMLISPGTETHSFDPTPKDIRTIQSCDLFIYGGGESDAWMKDILSSVGTDTQILAMTELFTLLEVPHTEDGHSHSAYDEHVWTSPANALRILYRIRDAVSEIDSANASVYSAQAEAYAEEIRALDADFAALVEGAERKNVLFADRFPFLYFVRQYGLSYRAAYPGCAEKTEPGPKTVAELIDAVQQDGIPVVFYTEFSDQRLADAICEKTDAVKLLFHSCHNVSKDDFAAGASYVSLMRENLNNLRKALY